MENSRIQRSLLALAFLCVVSWLGSARAEDSVETLINRLKSDSTSTRRNAVIDLGAIGVEYKKVVPALIEALEDTKRGIRVEAAQALKQYGREAKDAIPALKKAQKEDNSTLKAAATEALKSIEKE